MTGRDDSVSLAAIERAEEQAESLRKCAEAIATAHAALLDKHRKGSLGATLHQAASTCERALGDELVRIDVERRRIAEAGQ